MEGRESANKVSRYQALASNKNWESKTKLTRTEENFGAPAPEQDAGTFPLTAVLLGFADEVVLVIIVVGGLDVVTGTLDVEVWLVVLGTSGDRILLATQALKLGLLAAFRSWTHFP